MEYTREEFRDLLLANVAAGHGIKFIAYYCNEDTENKIDQALDAILSRFDHAFLKASAYTATKELVINAAKANFKNVFFTESGADIYDSEMYHAKSLEFKNILEKQGAHEWAEKCRSNGLSVVTHFAYNEHGLRVRVTNNLPLSPEDDRRIRDRLRLGATYDDLAKFYLEQGDSLEGAGIGIALVQMMLKGEGIDHKKFTIWSDGETATTAQVIFPFADFEKIPHE